MKARTWNLLLDVTSWLFGQSGIDWRTWRSLSTEMRRDGLHGYAKERTK